jgi:uncharacterized protein (TIGR03435 family)
LLAERFNLRVRYESRPTPIYALTIAREDRRLGAELRSSTTDCSPQGRSGTLAFLSQIRAHNQR